VKFLFLPEGDDPDTYVRREGKGAFEQLLSAALPLSEYALRTLTGSVNMGTVEGRARFLQEAKPLVLGVNAPILRLMLLKQVSELAGVTQAELEDRFQIRAAKRPPQVGEAAQRRSADLYTKLLERVLAQPSLIRELAAFVPPEPTPATADVAALIHLVEECRDLEREPTPQFVLELLRDHGAVVRRLQKPVSELEAFTLEELRDEVRSAIQGLRVEAENYRRVQAAQGVSSTLDLSPEQRALLSKARDRSDAVKTS
jgi:DNA primase